MSAITQAAYVDHHQAGDAHIVGDVREDAEFAASRVPGTRSVLMAQLPDRIDPNRPDAAGVAATAQRELVRIGIDRPAATTGGPERWTTDPLASFPRATFAGLVHCAGETFNNAKATGLRLITDTDTDTDQAHETDDSSDDGEDHEP